jgi:hypothetical protein
VPIHEFSLNRSNPRLKLLKFHRLIGKKLTRQVGYTVFSLQALEQWRQMCNASGGRDAELVSSARATPIYEGLRSG